MEDTAQRTEAPEIAFSLTEAASLWTRRDGSSVSRKTFQRAVDRNDFPNAQRLDAPAGAGTGPWSIPACDLEAAGYRHASISHVEPERTPDVVAIGGLAPVRELELTVVRLTAELENERARRAAESKKATTERARANSTLAQLRKERDELQSQLGIAAAKVDAREELVTELRTSRDYEREQVNKLALELERARTNVTGWH